MGLRRTLTLLTTAAAALALASIAQAAPGLLVGVADHTILNHPQKAGQQVRNLHLRAIRVPILWEPGRTSLPASLVAELDGAVAEAGSDIRLVPIVYSENGTDAPTTGTRRAEYCGFVQQLVARYPSFTEVAIWIEQNTERFWSPQYNPDGSSAAPAAYAQLLAECYDAIHAVRPTVKVIAGTTASRGNNRPFAIHKAHSPTTFIRRMGDAYRAMGRTQRLFDTVGHNPYPEHSAERVWKTHPRGTTSGQGDWLKLMQALHDAYSGTGQPIPGDETPAEHPTGDVAIWYLEVGYQTRPAPGKRSAYTGGENTLHPLSADVAEPAAPGSARPNSLAASQGTQLADGVALAYCQPYVEAYFNFKLTDERQLDRWQSGVFWADGTRKPSYRSLKAAAIDVRKRRIDCAPFKKGASGSAVGVGSIGAVSGDGPGGAAAGSGAGFVPKSGVEVERLRFAKKKAFNWKHDQWRFQIKVDEDADYAATLERTVRPRKRRNGDSRKPRATSRPGRVILQTDGSLRGGYFQWVKFDRTRLRRGSYRIVLTLTSKINPDRTTTVRGKVFSVKPKKRRPGAPRR